jgi:hypothetical protein
MKGLILIALISLSLAGKSQCTECTTLAEALKDPQKVRTLKFNGWQSGIKLDSLPRTIGLLVNAETIYISDHNIKTIPKEIAYCTQLKVLSFAACQLESLPEEIFTLTNLKELILNDNQFSDETKKALEIKFKKLLPKTKIIM